MRCYRVALAPTDRDILRSSLCSKLVSQGQCGHAHALHLWHGEYFRHHTVSVHIQEQPLAGSKSRKWDVGVVWLQHRIGARADRCIAAHVLNLNSRRDGGGASLSPVSSCCLRLQHRPQARRGCAVHDELQPDGRRRDRYLHDNKKYNCRLGPSKKKRKNREGRKFETRHVENPMGFATWPDLATQNAIEKHYKNK